MGGSSRKKSCCEGLCTSLVGLGVIILIYWAIFQPHQIRAHVGTAILSNFTLTNSTPSSTITLSYNLALNLSLYNPSLRVGIYYDRLDAALYYNGALLGPANATEPSEFFQRHKTGSVVHPEFEGRVVAAGDVSSDNVVGSFKSDKREGFFNLEMRIDAEVRYKFGIVKNRQKPKIDCRMRIPAPPENGGIGVLGSGDRCSVKY